MLRKSYVGDTSPADSTCWGCNDRPRQVQLPADIDPALDLSRTSDVPGTSLRHALSIFEIVDFRSLIAHTFKSGEFSLALEIIQRASRLKKSAPAASQLLRIFETLVQCEQQYADLTCASLPAKTWALCRGARGRYTDGSKRSRKTKEMFAAYTQLIADCESVAQMYPAAATGRRPPSIATTNTSPATHALRPCARHPFPFPEGTCCRSGTWHHNDVAAQDVLLTRRMSLYRLTSHVCCQPMESQRPLCLSHSNPGEHVDGHITHHAEAFASRRGNVLGT